MVKPNYTCSQQDLYTAARTIATSVDHNLPALTAFSPIYNAAYVTNLVADIDGAEALPNEQARYAAAEAGRLNLTTLARTGCNHWQILKRYITKAFGEAEHKVRFEEAGSKHYTAASNQNWEALRSLLNSGSAFLATHSTALTAVMPATFPATFNDCRSDVQTQYTNWLSAEQQAQGATQAKIIANNAIYTTLASICADGQVVFENDGALKRQFTFDQVLQIVSGGRASGIKGTITDSATNIPIAGVTITSASEFKQYTTQTNEVGHYEINQLPAGQFAFTFQKAGYTTLTENVAIQTSTKSTQNLALVAASA